jgi:(2Fe-2S) ferredoxin/SAM-dependent methyltransferase
MEPFRYHVFICDQQKPEGVPSCSACGSARTIEALRREIQARGLGDDVQITLCGSIGLCEHGPNMIVYPEGVWYSGVTPGDVPEMVTSHFENGVPVERLARVDGAALRAEILTNREKMMASRRAREAAGALPDELAEQMRAFQESRVILTALELDVFAAVGDGASAEEVAALLRTHPRSTGMLLNALTAMGLLAKSGGQFRNTPVTARHFTANAPHPARMAALHTAHLWLTWSNLTESVRSGTAVPLEGRDDGWTEAFIAAMHRNASERTASVVRAVGAESVARMLDVGGGSGAYSIAFAKANPNLRAEIVDLAPVGVLARRHIAEAGVGARVHVSTGDLRTDRFGEGYDLAFVSAICHMLSEDENRDLFRRCREALAPGGRLVVQDFILEPDKTAPRFAALFALNMLVGTRAGSAYSEPEYALWMGEAGIRDIRRVRLPGPADLMIGVR